MFNSNDYLGLRHSVVLKKAEHAASKIFGTGPGAVRFISGSLSIYQELESEIARFHDKEAGIVFSSAFAANLAVISAFAKPQSKDSLVGDDVFIISDELNHRSIIDGICLASIPKDGKAVFSHKNMDALRTILDDVPNCRRVLIITDGVFSMLGDYQDLSKVRAIMGAHDHRFEDGIILIVDDAHRVSCFGKLGRGTEEVSGGKADLLVGTFGKGFGVDGGYVVGKKIFIDYLRESAATYIYSNSISPGSAGAALASIRFLSSDCSRREFLNKNIDYFKQAARKKGLSFVADSSHAIQPLLIGDSSRCKQLASVLFGKGVLVTPISYPVVSKGKDELRIQLSSVHKKKDIDLVLSSIS